MFSRILLESYRQAIGQLSGNRLRTLLSLLGISIGIFCIIAVKSAVDSLELEIKTSFNELGEDVLYVTRTPWTEDPGMNYWKYMRRPDPNFSDYKALANTLKGADQVSIIYLLGSRTIKQGNNALERVFMSAISDSYGPMFDLKMENGRYFSPFEYQNGSNKILLGSVTAENLFGKKDPIGQEVKIIGQKFQIIGVIQRKGKSLINIINFDESVVLPLSSARKYLNLGDKSPFGSIISAKAQEGSTLADLKDEVELKMRVHRKLKPVEENNFALNELTMLTSLLDRLFGVINIAGFMIGIFALFVGMFSVANIMFVSVKERTAIIGIKKSLGARPNVILLEFLVESSILCLIGGILGLVLVFLIMAIINAAVDFAIFLSFENVIIGLVTSAFIGILSGFLPALQAAKMDPVEAMRK
jgi:putative ABC transport system permease protein